MLMVAVFAAAAAAPVAELPKGNASLCGVTIEKVGLLPDLQVDVPHVPPFGWSPEAKRQALTVSHIMKQEADMLPTGEGMLPKSEVGGHGPAVLLPDCKPEPRKKRKKRLSDYPMA